MAQGLNTQAYLKCKEQSRQIRPPIGALLAKKVEFVVKQFRISIAICRGDAFPNQTR